jgi:hypothetical protein
MLLCFSALMDVLAKASDGFELHPLDEESNLPCLNNNRVEDGFPGSAVLAFKSFLVWDKQNRVAQSPSAISVPSPHRFNDEKDFKAPTAMWGVIRVKGNANIKEACKALAWDMTGLGLQVRLKEHQ